jgi:hypothetical protein
VQDFLLSSLLLGNVDNCRYTHRIAYGRSTIGTASLSFLGIKMPPTTEKELLAAMEELFRLRQEKGNPILRLPAKLV